jgi:hypothetical protein
LVFEKKRQLFRRKLAKIVENCDHKIDPRYYGARRTASLITLEKKTFLGKNERSRHPVLGNPLEASSDCQLANLN